MLNFYENLIKNNILRRFQEETIIAVITQTNFYVNGICKYGFFLEEFKHVGKSKTTIQLILNKIFRKLKKHNTY